MLLLLSASYNTERTFRETRGIRAYVAISISGVPECTLMHHGHNDVHAKDDQVNFHAYVVHTVLQFAIITRAGLEK